MIDIHSHILTYVNGTNNPTTQDLRIGLEAFKKELGRVGIPLELYIGNEIYTSQSTIDDINKDKIIGLNDSKYLLMELPMNDVPLFVEDL